MPPRTRRATAAGLVTTPRHKDRSHIPSGSAVVQPLLDTPYADNTEAAPLRSTVANIKKTLFAQFKRPGAKIEGGPEYTKNALKPNATTARRIDAFLARTDLYDSDSMRWVNIPRTPEAEDELYNPLVEIFQSTLDEFGVMDRHVTNTSPYKVKHKETSSKEVLWSSPDIMVCDKGFCGMDISQAKDHPTYATCIAPIEVKCHKNMNAKERILQVGVYARQCFIEQFGRMYLYSAVITENHITLYQLDRCGVIYSDRVDYHEDPNRFICWILGMCSSNAKKIGFDSTVRHEGERTFVKARAGAAKRRVEFRVEEILELHPPMICGKDTICLSVWSTEVGEKVIKQFWRSTAREPEEKFLAQAKGLEGVAQMVACEILYKVSEFRCTAQPPEFRDREFVRITFEHYGSTIEEFVSELQLLCTLRDAVAGHQNLHDKGILHRDIHIKNVLSGDMSYPGNRGIIIDLGQSIFLGRTDSLAGKDLRTGSRVFQSISVLMSTKRPHSYLDDLESFFYVILWICVAYRSPKKLKQPLPGILNKWCLDDPTLCGSVKRMDVTDRYEEVIEPLISKSFGKPFKDLLRQLREIVWARYPRDLMSLKKTKAQQTVKEVQEEAKPIYKQFIKAIDTAILCVQNASASSPIGTNVDDDTEVDDTVSEDDNFLNPDSEMSEYVQPKRYRSDGSSEAPSSPGQSRTPKRARVVSLISSSDDSDRELPYSSPLQRRASMSTNGKAYAVAES